MQACKTLSASIVTGSPAPNSKTSTFCYDNFSQIIVFKSFTLCLLKTLHFVTVDDICEILTNIPENFYWHVTENLSMHR